jgi:4'-phosphopantetheinyl transferase
MKATTTAPHRRLLRQEARGLAWQPVSSDVRLQPDELHVWRASLACDPAKLNRMEATLAEDEIKRAQRLRFEKDRNHFIAGRGILRDLLARYVSRAPAELRFRYGALGKPALDVAETQQSVRFNFATDEIAVRYFSSRELAEWRALPSNSRAEGFFLCWTRKEAYVKARGAGLHIPLDSFSLSLTPGKPEILESGDSEQWSVCSLQPAAGFVGGVVGKGLDRRLR